MDRKLIDDLELVNFGGISLFDQDSVLPSVAPANLRARNYRAITPTGGHYTEKERRSR